MSGGSWNYLFLLDDTDIINRRSDVERMAARLESLGYAKDSAHDTRKVLAAIDVVQSALDTLYDEMCTVSNIWRGVEYWDSGDTNEQGFIDNYLGPYREEKESNREKNR